MGQPVFLAKPNQAFYRTNPVQIADVSRIPVRNLQAPKDRLLTALLTLHRPRTGYGSTVMRRKWHLPAAPLRTDYFRTTDTETPVARRQVFTDYHKYVKYPRIS